MICDYHYEPDFESIDCMTKCGTIYYGLGLRFFFSMVWVLIPLVCCWHFYNLKSRLQKRSGWEHWSMTKACTHRTKTFFTCKNLLIVNKWMRKDGRKSRFSQLAGDLNGVAYFCLGIRVIEWLTLLVMGTIASRAV